MTCDFYDLTGYRMSITIETRDINKKVQFTEKKASSVMVLIVLIEKGIDVRMICQGERDQIGLQQETKGIEDVE